MQKFSKHLIKFLVRKTKTLVEYKATIKKFGFSRGISFSLYKSRLSNMCTEMRLQNDKF